MIHCISVHLVCLVWVMKICKKHLFSLLSHWATLESQSKDSTFRALKTVVCYFLPSVPHLSPFLPFLHGLQVCIMYTSLHSNSYIIHFVLGKMLVSLSPAEAFLHSVLEFMSHVSSLVNWLMIWVKLFVRALNQIQANTKPSASHLNWHRPINWHWSQHLSISKNKGCSTDWRHLLAERGYPRLKIQGSSKRIIQF